ncbi:hypothetical protein [Hazenella coriacea]|uniref:Uncharacterized protein n=1 Tax=Hazenella coriacea TaxID=1179467 RepID=A0A4R3L757_9BACL|nr:hypothetical protein [Hazenella coriacea]TCS94865.1 hypothetical protein EDD58_103288 [Hazenella coriacea]
MSAWDELTRQVNDNVAETTTLLVEIMFELLEEYIQNKNLEEARARQLYEEAMKQIEAQLKQKIEMDLKGAEQKQPELQQNNDLDQEAFQAKPSSENEIHTQATEALETESNDHLAKEVSSVENDGKSLTFDSFDGQQFYFRDEEQNRYSIHEKELPLSLETKAMIDVYQYMKNEGREKTIEKIRDAQKTALREGRPAQQIYAEKMKKDVAQNVLKYRFALLSQTKDAMNKLDKVKKDIRLKEKAVNERIGKLYHNYHEGKVGKGEFEKEKNKLLKEKGQISQNMGRYQVIEGRLKKGLQGELKKMFPEMKVNHLNLKSTFEITAAASGKKKPFKNAKELNGFLKEKNFPNLSRELEKGLNMKGKSAGIELNAFA